MKIQIASDLHLELLGQGFPGYRVIEPADADVLVIAGDIHRHTGAINTFADWPVPVVYVHGNHESYRAQYVDLIANMRRAAQGSRVHYLERDEWVHGGVRFLGCCLWTDYCITEAPQEEAMHEAERILYDHQLIAMPDGLFSAADALQLHRDSRAWLQEKLDQPFSGPTVVVTHHAPHPGSIHPRFAGTVLNAAFISDLTPLMGKAALWIHGHVHDSFDYEIAGTHIVANPRGYALNRKTATSPAEIEWENKAFDARRVVEI